MRCRSCGQMTERAPFLRLPAQPPANRFLDEREVYCERKYPLELVFCPYCYLVQLTEGSLVPRMDLFDEYAYASSVSSSLRGHFELLVDRIREYVSKDGLVVDIGSNDGVLLKPLQEKGFRALGVEPAKNLAEMANAKGLRTIHGYLNAGSVAKVLRVGVADVVVAANVFAHTDDIDGFLWLVGKILRYGGVFIAEVQYFYNTVKDLSFDNVYHEHVSYYTLASMTRALELNGLNVFDVQRIDTHGGSLRVYATNGITGKRESLTEVANLELNGRMNLESTYRTFAGNAYVRISEFQAVLRKIGGKKVAGYGAAAKSSTMLNSAAIDNTSIAYIVDDSPLKQGKFAPGSHILIVSIEYMKEHPPDYVVIFAWNNADQVIENMQKLPIPKPRFIIPTGPDCNLGEIV